MINNYAKMFQPTKEFARYHFMIIFKQLNLLINFNNYLS